MEKTIKFSEHVLRENKFIEPPSQPSTSKTTSLKYPKTIRITVTDPYATDSSSSDDENKSIVKRRVKKHVTEIKLKRKKTSNYRGVSRRMVSGKWVAQILDTLQKKRFWLGTYDTAEQAALAYNEAALRLEGTHAITPTTTSTSEKKYLGVSKKSNGKWAAVIWDPLQKKLVWLGTYDTAEEAVVVYDEAALRFDALRLQGTHAITTTSTTGEKKYLGVRRRPYGKWGAYIWDPLQRKHLWLGSYDTAEQAAVAYDEAAVRLNGSHAVTNFGVSPHGFGEVDEFFDLPEFGRYRSVDEFSEFDVDDFLIDVS